MSAFLFHFIQTMCLKATSFLQVNLKILCMSVCKFLSWCWCWCWGKNSVRGLFANSALGQALQAGTLNVPAPCPLPSAPELGPPPHVIVADEAFSLKPYVLCWTGLSNGHYGHRPSGQCAPGAQPEVFSSSLHVSIFSQ